MPDNNGNNQNNNDDDEYEKYCYLCRRPESEACADLSGCREICISATTVCRKVSTPSTTERCSF